MTVTETLVAARAHLAAVGLHKGDYYADPLHKATTPCCLHGALHMVASPFDVMWAGQALARHLPLLPATWNDRDETTLADVLALFDRAIEASRT
jgi:hypothetical protein